MIILYYIFASFVMLLIFTFIMGEMESDLKQKLEYRIENYEEFEKK